MTPPAGPDRIALEPENLSTCARPPSLYMKKTDVFEERSASKPFLKPSMYLITIE